VIGPRRRRAGSFRQPWADAGLQRVVDPRLGIPDVRFAHRRKRSHAFAIGPRACAHHPLSMCAGEAAAARCDREAGCEALEVPFPGSGQGFVEVVDVEHQAALR
jgi:hypothetical protein